MASFEYAYAKALYRTCPSVAEQQDCIAFLLNLEQLARQEDFQRFYSDRKIAIETKCKLIQDALKITSSTKKRFVEMLVSRNKLNAISEIVRAFQAYLFELSSVVNVPVTSAKPLESDQTKTIENYIKHRYKKDVHFIPAVDDAITGIEFRVGSDVLNYTGSGLIDRAVFLLKKL